MRLQFSISGVETHDEDITRTDNKTPLIKESLIVVSGLLGAFAVPPTVFLIRHHAFTNAKVPERSGEVGKSPNIAVFSSLLISFCIALFISLDFSS